MAVDIQALEDRRSFSSKRLEELRERLAKLPEICRLPGLTVYATGSYARHEASPHSDIDLFFVHRGAKSEHGVSRLDELRLFARVIDIGEKMEFPTFSNDGEYLQILYLDEMLAARGKSPLPT